MQVHQVRNKGAEHRLVLDVCNVVFEAGLPDQFADPRIVDVADSWEKVMLNLEVQSTQKPKQESARGAEIGR